MTKFKPHLAIDADPNKLPKEMLIMPKIDGCRLIVKDGKAVGRSMKSYKNKKLTEYFSKPEWEGIDCEVVATYLTDPSLCRKTTSLVNTIEGSLPFAIYIFDYLHEDVIDKPFRERIEVASAKFKGVGGNVLVNVAEGVVLTTDRERVDDMYQQALEQGYEGIVIRDANGMHKNGRCTKNEAAYLRMKPSADAEGIVVELIEALENKNEAKKNELGYTERSSHKENKEGKGMIGAMIINLVDSSGKLTGKQEKIGAGKLTHGQRKYYWEHPEQIVGKIVKWRSMSGGVKDKARHGRFIGFRAKEDMSNE